jgi:hypothetical protein
MAPSYLSDCLPTTIGETVTYNVRNNDDYHTQRCLNLLVQVLNNPLFYKIIFESVKDLFSYTCNTVRCPC